MKPNKIILTVGLSVCVGILFSVAAEADPALVQPGAGYNDAPAHPAIQQSAVPEEKPTDNAAAQTPAQEPAENDAAQEIPVQEPADNGSADTSGMPDYDISLFSHQVHVGGMGFGCADCHSGIFEQAAGTAKAAGDFNMASFSEGKYCGACHDGSTAFSVKDEVGCKRCHGSDMKQPRTIVFEKPVKAVVFNHTMHTDEIGLACADCHDGLFKMKMGTSEAQTDFTMASMYKGKYCGACHDGATAFDSKTRCTKCHIGVSGYNRLFGDAKKEAGHEEGGH